LKMDFWKKDFGIDVAFNHRSFIGGDLLRLQAAAEVKNIIKVGVYLCATKEFAKHLSPKDASSMVSFERARWYLESFYPVITTPIYLLGLSK
jgi:Restriction endonuclease BglII